MSTHSLTIQQTNNFFNCVKRFVVDKKLGFSVRVLDGSYYSCGGVLNNEESFGLLDTKWSAFKKDGTIVRATMELD